MSAGTGKLYSTHPPPHTLPSSNFQCPSLCIEQASGIFGQPIDKIATDQMQGRPSSGSSSSAGTPMSIGSRSGSLQPPSSPTSTDTCFMEAEPNPTAVLLEALSKTDKATAPPSPKTQRQLALRPSEPRVPPIVRKAIAYLDQTAVKTEGLFRISGSKARIQEVSYDTSTPGRVSLTLNRKECLGNTRWLAFMSCVHRRVVGYFQFPSQTKSCFHRAERFFF